MNSAPRKAPQRGPGVLERPQPAPPEQSGTTEQLRADIDSGKTRDKVAFPDPAAAPLGTDAEAGGTPTSPTALAAERRNSSHPMDADELRRRPWITVWLLGIIAVALAMMTTAMLVASN